MGEVSIAGDEEEAQEYFCYACKSHHFEWIGWHPQREQERAIPVENVGGAEAEEENQRGGSGRGVFCAVKGGDEPFTEEEEKDADGNRPSGGDGCEAFEQCTEFIPCFFANCASNLGEGGGDEGVNRHQDQVDDGKGSFVVARRNLADFAGEQEPEPEDFAVSGDEIDCPAEVAGECKRPKLAFWREQTERRAHPAASKHFVGTAHPPESQRKSEENFSNQIGC